ncbi:hypothetical protein B0H11DRAFT_1708029, partial [Mycena galericulata]
MWNVWAHLAVRNRLSQILPKWDPQIPESQVVPPPPNLSENELIFSPPPKLASLTEGFRVFTKSSETAGTAPDPPLVIQTLDNTITANISAFCHNEGQADAQAGAGIWYAEGDPRNKSLKIPQNLSQTRSNAEAIATLHCIQSTPLHVELHIACNSNSIALALCNHINKWENNGWIGIPDRAPLQALAAGLKTRMAVT